MNYIGIRGHRGAGKNTITYLLANTIEYLVKGKDILLFDKAFNEWCVSFRQNEQLIDSLCCDHVIVEGFGDGPKMLLSMLTGISLQDMNSDYSKDHILVNLKDFSRAEVGEIDDEHIWTAADYVGLHRWIADEPAVLKEDTWMTLRELILYFGIYIMQNAFGRNVWVKSLIANHTYYDSIFAKDNDYKIFNDIKAKSEITYIKDLGGVIIKVTRPGHRKNGGMDLLKGDNRFDYEVVIDGELETLKDTILDIAQKIINL